MKNCARKTVAIVLVSLAASVGANGVTEANDGYIEAASGTISSVNGHPLNRRCSRAPVR